MNHWFWWLLSVACVAWYSTVTVYVAIKGTGDIKRMFAFMSKQLEASSRPTSEAKNDKTERSFDLPG